MTEQRYRAVLKVEAGVPVTEVAERFGVSRQAVHRWIGWYRNEGLEGLADRSHRPRSHPAQTSPEVEAAICELRRTHRRWGQRRIAFELGRQGCPGPIPSVSTIYRVLVRHGLVDAVPRKCRREDYRRWERAMPMELWQLDIVDGIRLADGSETKIVTGVDDHSRYCVIATAVRRATGRAICGAFADALREYGIPDEVLTDNGKQFTGRFTRPRPAEVMFERICRENGSVARNTKPRSPTTTGKVERFHQTLQRELLDHVQVWPDLATAQAAIDAFRHEYNTDRPHQSLNMAFPAARFVPRTVDEVVPLRLPAALPSAELARRPVLVPAAALQSSSDGVEPLDLAVEFVRVVPSSGNLTVGGQQFWLGPDRAGGTVTFWADISVVHLLVNGVRLKSVPSRLTITHLRRLLNEGGCPAGAPDRQHPAGYGDRGRPHRQCCRRRRTRRTTTSGRLPFRRPQGDRPPRPGLAPTRPGRCVAAQPAQPAQPGRHGAPPRCPARRAATPASRRPAASRATDQQPWLPGRRRAAHPRRHGPRRAHRYRRGRRHHLADLPRRRTAHRSCPHYDQTDRPVQGPQA
jgi:transposase InsO family protein